MRKPVSTSDAPRAIGPYHQAIVASGARTIFLSGQIALDPASGELLAGGVEEQTRRVMENLKAVLAAAGAAFDRVVKTTVFLADMADFARMNEVYAGYFGDAPPARSTVQVAALPRGARVEIDAIAVVDGRGTGQRPRSIRSADRPRIRARSTRTRRPRSSGRPSASPRGRRRSRG